MAEQAAIKINENVLYQVDFFEKLGNNSCKQIKAKVMPVFPGRCHLNCMIIIVNSCHCDHQTVALQFAWVPIGSCRYQWQP